MNKIFVSLTLLLLTFYSSVWSEERIAGSLENVDLIIEDILNKKGHNYGERYFAINRNNYPIRLSIKLVDIKNAENKLLPFTIVIKSLDKVKLGKVVQLDPKEESSWNYEWDVQADQQ